MANQFGLNIPDFGGKKQMSNLGWMRRILSFGSFRARPSLDTRNGTQPALQSGRTRDNYAACARLSTTSSAERNAPPKISLKDGLHDPQTTRGKTGQPENHRVYLVFGEIPLLCTKHDPDLAWGLGSSHLTLSGAPRCRIPDPAGSRFRLLGGGEPLSVASCKCPLSAYALWCATYHTEC